MEGVSNLDMDERNVVGRFVQKSQTGWNLQYTYDERYCARAVTNEIQFYQSQDLGIVWNKVRVEGVTDFAVSPGENHSIAVFVAERKVSDESSRIQSSFLSPLLGSTCGRQDLQCAEFRYPSVSKELLQR